MLHVESANRRAKVVKLNASRVSDTFVYDQTYISKLVAFMLIDDGVCEAAMRIHFTSRIGFLKGFPKTRPLVLFFFVMDKNKEKIRSK